VQIFFGHNIEKIGDIETEIQQLVASGTQEEIHKLFQRVTQDIRGLPEWNDLSIDMMNKVSSGVIRPQHPEELEGEIAAP